VSLPKIPSEALSNDTELASSLDLLGQHKVGALLVMASPYFDTRRDRIIAAAAQNKLPAIYQLRESSITDASSTPAPTRDKSSRAQNRPIFRSSSRQNLNSWSISRPRKPSALPFRPG
jgi:hypothetical protein